MSAGISFLPSNQLTLYSQYDKNLDNPGQLKFGLEYSYSAITLRTGLITNPALLSFGIGFHHKRLSIDYGIRNHQVLNASHIFTLTYHFQDGE
jgi:nucleoside-specific outer membrane channel protein Tsx